MKKQLIYVGYLVGPGCLCGEGAEEVNLDVKARNGSFPILGQGAPNEI